MAKINPGHRKMLDWDGESRFPAAAEITEGLVISILDTTKFSLTGNFT